MTDMATPSPHGDAPGHAHMLSPDQFTSHGTSPVSTFSQGYTDGRSQATAPHTLAPPDPAANNAGS